MPDPTEGVRPSKLGGEEMLRLVEEECHGFCYATHATNANGVLEQKANHLWKNPWKSIGKRGSVSDERNATTLV